MSFSLKHLKRIDNRYRFTVFGYIRNVQNKLSLSNIPLVISYISLSYYYHGEYFEKAGDHYIISNDKMTVTKIKTNDTDHTAYGKTWIPSISKQIAKWKCLIVFGDIDKELFADMDEAREYSSFWICIVSKDNRMNEDCGKEQDAPNYAFSVIGNNLDFYGQCEINGEYPMLGDENIFIVTLDTKNAEIRLQINDDEFCIYKGIEINNDIEYKMAVMILEKRNSISLLDFECEDK